MIQSPQVDWKPAGKQRTPIAWMFHEALECFIQRLVAVTINQRFKHYWNNTCSSRNINMQKNIYSFALRWKIQENGPARNYYKDKEHPFKFLDVQSCSLLSCITWSTGLMPRILCTSNNSFIFLSSSHSNYLLSLAKQLPVALLIP